MKWINDEDGGAMESQVGAAESRLGVDFPTAYRKMLLDHAGAESEELELMIPPSELLPASELDVAEFDCMASWAAADLELLIPIFRSLSGSYYALDYSKGAAPRVLDLDHDEDSAHDYGTFEEFLAKLEG